MSLSTARVASGLAKDYRPEVDGLRAVAVLAVIVYHAELPWLRGGFAGVDVFFVVSGYLITRLILAERDAGHFSLLRFFERRARRILPALYLVIAACLPFAWMLMFPEELRRFGDSVLSVLLLVANFYFVNTQDYFAPGAELSPLLHAWSLSAEEQFYLVFPILALATLSISRRAFVGCILCLATASLGLAQFGGLLHENAGGLRWLAPPAWGYYLLPTRAWELLLGAALAAGRFEQTALNARLPGLLRQTLGIAGIALIVASCLFYRRSTPFPTAYALVPTIGTALVILFARQGTLAHAALAWRPLVGIGLMSYSLYLWHQPVLAFSRLYLPRGMSEVWLVGAVALSFLLAWLGWRFVEQPCRDRAAVSTRAFALGVILSGLALGAAGYACRVVGADPMLLSRAGAISARVDHAVGLSPACVYFGSWHHKPECATGDEPEAIVWGDSFAAHTVNAIVAANPGLPLLQATMPVCGPIPGIAPVVNEYDESWGRRCIQFNQAVLEHVLASPSIREVILGIHFANYIWGEQKLFDGTRVRSASPERLRGELRAAIGRLRAAGKRVTLISSPARSLFDVGRCLALATWRSLPGEICDFSYSDHPQNAFIDAFLRSLEGEGVHVIALRRLLCPQDRCSATLDGAFLYRDKAHLAAEGSTRMGIRFPDFRLRERN